jgi:hypothetical protein
MHSFISFHGFLYSNDAKMMREETHRPAVPTHTHTQMLFTADYKVRQTSKSAITLCEQVHRIRTNKLHFGFVQIQTQIPTHAAQAECQTAHAFVQAHFFTLGLCQLFLSTEIPFILLGCKVPTCRLVQDGRTTCGLFVVRRS